MTGDPGGSMTTIHEVLDSIRATSSSEREKGDRFERLMRAFLSKDVVWSERFGQVWLWNDWPERTGADVGIDLVAEDRTTGELCAIQCKFYDPDHRLVKSDIDSFFTASGKAPFASRLIISTTDHWTSHAEAALANQQIPVTRLRVADLDSSTIDWQFYVLTSPDDVVQRAPKQIRPHQQAALDDVIAGFASHDRGKLIMACGTGKTFTSLKITETMVPTGGSVLVLVPSISLLSQTLTEWGAAASVPLRPFAVCSDTKVGRRRTRDDSEDISLVDLPFPASTDPQRLADRAGVEASDGITVVYSTYQSIGVIAEAQRLGLPEFDLIICDEAHRTTGVTLFGSDESHFVKVHDNDYIRAGKRLYMTATPRLYDENTKSAAQQNAALICSMDDEDLYGPEFHRLGFGKAVGDGLLTDYKVLILTVDEEYIAGSLQPQLADENNEINLDDAVKIVGCWNGLAKRAGAATDGSTFKPGEAPMARAVAFSRSIAESQALTAKFDEVIGAYNDAHEGTLACQVRHVDGTFNALARNAQLDWLKEPLPELSCRILSNARCLSEGVDVPDLDAVLFLNPRNSVVDVVQSVGRVMRKAEGKDYGYIILPVGIPSGMKPEVALKDNKRYRVIWQVLQALRAHDDRFNATVNKIELNKEGPKNIMVAHVGPDDEDGGQPADSGDAAARQIALFNVEEWRDAIYAKIVTKVGQRAYWENWAADVAAIAERHVHRINERVADENSEAGQAFTEFLAELRTNINPGLSRADAIDMLAQHLITKPVFDALFGSEEFTSHNPVSVTMDAMLATLDDQALAAEHDQLQGFYDSVRLRADGIDNHEGRQRIITELYERFFKVALPKTADAFGIVYTPIEIVDFILRSVDWALREYFGADISSEGVQVLDPFTGTGTFIVRLLQSGLIRPEDLERKYRHELNANEILLLAYYIAGVNIEATYAQLRAEAQDALASGSATADGYEPFDGIVLTDTFQLTEDADRAIPEFLEENTQRLERQKALDIKVIIGNPPYSVGQTSQNDDNRNQSYPRLDSRIELTYAKESNAGLKRNLYDSYIRAIRWASDRIGDSGIVCYVTNGAWIDTGSADGLRKTLVEEFDAIYVFNLRGNQRTQGETSRREGGKVFGSGSRTPVAVTLLVKLPFPTDGCEVRYHDIGDYLAREEKLAIVKGFDSVPNVRWTLLEPDDNGDWINQQDPTFDLFTPLGAKKDPTAQPIFGIYSLGVVTNRDAWAYNFDRAALLDNMGRTIDFYNQQRSELKEALKDSGTPRTQQAVEAFIDQDPTKISWTRALKADLRKDKPAALDPDRAVPSMYRPYCKQWLYFDRQFNEMVLLQPQLFPTPRHDNLVISMTGQGASRPFSCLMTDSVPNLHLNDTGQTFPLYRYEKTNGEGDLFSAPDEYGYVRHDAITDHTITTYRERYGASVTKEDIFYYVYGILHSSEYRSRYATNLAKAMPRIPMVDNFAEFSQAGRDLAHWHLNYEAVQPWPLDGFPEAGIPEEHLRVSKMHFGKRGKDSDRSRIVVNGFVTLGGIPEEAYSYTVNGKPALEWLLDRYEVTTDKDSGIINDPNMWSDDPRYIVDLVARMVTVSVESARIIAALPPLGLDT